MTDLFTPSLSPNGAGPRTRMAYTLNNAQPVKCTYVSEEPLFYLDNPVPEEEELSLSADLMADLSQVDPLGPISALKDETDTLALFQEQFAQGAVLADTPLETTLALIEKSRVGAALLAYAREQGVTLAIVPQIADAEYERTAGRVTLRPHLQAAEQAMLVLRELRRVWQHRQGALIHPLLFHPDHAIVINRVLTADLTTFVVRAAWELRLAGDHMLWTALEENGHEDLTRSFAREALLDFRSLNNGRANAAAFESWFLSERCRPHDRALIQQMLADYQGYVFKAGHVETSKVLTQQLIASLGAMPFGKNYLSAHAATILTDPIFTEIRDRSSANFLWFIKFEQSFRQTERDLQKEEGASSLASSSDAVSFDKGSSDHADPATAQIIRLPQSGRSNVPPLGVGSNDATIVDLQGWRRAHLSE